MSRAQPTTRTPATPPAPPAPTRYANYTDAMLADELGQIDEEHEVVAERQAEARLEMSRRGRWAIEGQVFVVSKSTVATTAIDTAAIRAEMGEDWVASRCKAGTRTTYRVGRKGDAAPARPKRAPRARKAKDEA